MKVQLLVSEWCPSCHQAEKVWREVAAVRDIEFEVLDLAQPEGRQLANDLRLRSVPSVVIDGQLKAVGTQTLEEALALVAGAPEKSRAETQYVGIGFARSSRFAILSAALYLLAAGAALAFRGALMLDTPARVAPLHLFTLGFVTFMIYGLGEHMLPRFTNRPIRAGLWPWAQLGLQHLGLVCFTAGLWLLQPALQLAGAVLAWTALVVFAARILPVLWPAGTGDMLDAPRAP